MYEDSDEDNEEKRQALTRRYSMIPDDEEIESDKSDDVMSGVKEEEDEEGYEPSITSEEEIEKTDTTVVMEAWDTIIGIKFKLNFNAILLDDPALQNMWLENDVETEDEEEIQNEESDLDLNELGQEESPSSTDTEEERRRIEEEEAEEEVHTSDKEGAENGDEGDFSLGDVNTDEEENNVETPEEEGGNEQQFEITSDYEEKLQERANEVEILEEAEKPKQYRKLPKYVSSDTSEYETIYSGSEPDEQNETKVIDLEVRVEKEVKVKPPNPYEWKEFHQEIEHMEEFDGNWMDGLYAKFKDSAPSSREESDFKNDERAVGDQYDVQKYDLNKTELSVVRNKHKRDEKHRNRKKRRQTENVKSMHKNEDTTRLPKTLKNHEIHQNKREYTEIINKNINPKDELTHFLNLNVYNFHNYPEYKDDKKTTRKSKEVRGKNKDKNKKKKSENNKKSSPLKPIEDKPAKTSKSSKGKERHYLKRKKRNLLYERLHPWYRLMTSQNKYESEDENPDEDIPSFKTKSKLTLVRDVTITNTMNLLMNQIGLAIAEIERRKSQREAAYHGNCIIDDICDKIFDSIHEKQKRDAVNYAIEILLDSLEEHVYATKLRLIENQLDYISEEIARTSITKCFDEMIEEDITATFLVRNAFAESLDELKMKRKKIHSKLSHMFVDYNFINFDFDALDRTRERKIKVYKQRKFYNQLLKDRTKKRELNEKEMKSKQTKKEESLSDEESLNVGNLEVINKDENQNKNENENKEEQLQQEEQGGDQVTEETNEEKPIENITPLDLSPQNSPQNSDTEKKITKISKKEAKERKSRMMRRIKVVNIWLNSNSKLLQSKRDKNANYWKDKQDIENQTDEGDEYENQKQNEDPDLNMKYELIGSDDNENVFENMNFGLNNLTLPKLNTEVDKALERSKTPDVIKPIMKKRDGRPETPETKDRNDSALGSETRSASKTKEEMVPDDQTEKEVNQESNENQDKPKQLLKHRESGFSSDMGSDLENDETTSNSKFLSPLVIEEEIGKSEIIKMIPKIDRDEYLHIWLEHGRIPSSNDVTPSPPPHTPTKKRTRKFRLKRPETSMSEETVRDIVPLDNYLYKRIQQRNDSAKSVERPETASTAYTGRESALSESQKIIEDREPELESEEDNKGSIKKLGAKRLSTVEQIIIERRVTQIAFEKWKNEEKQKIIDTSDEAAWSFYKKQHHVKKERIQTARKPRKPPPTDIPTKTKDAIVKKHAEILLKKTNKTLTSDLPFNETEDELLVLFQNDSEDNDNDSKPFYSPPPTPWELKEERSLTPDSSDSEEKLRELKREYDEQAARVVKRKLNELDKEMDNDEDRRWRAFMRKRHLEELQRIATDLPKKPPTPKTPILKTPLPTPPRTPKSGWAPGSGKSDAETRMKNNRELFHRLQIRTKNNKLQKVKTREKLLPRRSSIIPQNVQKENNRKIQSDGEYSRSPSKPLSKRSSEKASSEKPSYLKSTMSSERRTTTSSEKLPPIPIQNERKTKIKPKVKKSAPFY